MPTPSYPSWGHHIRQKPEFFSLIIRLPILLMPQLEGKKIGSHASSCPIKHPVPDAAPKV